MIRLDYVPNSSVLWMSTQRVGCYNKNKLSFISNNSERDLSLCTHKKRIPLHIKTKGGVIKVNNNL